MARSVRSDLQGTAERPVTRWTKKARRAIARRRAFIETSLREWWPGSRFAVLVARRASTAPATWLRKPLPLVDRDVCLFVAYAPDGHIKEHSLVQARGWSDAGFAVVVIVVSNDPERLVLSADLGFAEGVLVRLNRGYDFGAWASTISRLPQLEDARLLAIANDSVYGPLDSFGETLARVRKSAAGLIGLTDSYELGYHYQSYMMFFKPLALRHPLFRRFWSAVRNGGREFAIRQYETQLVRAFRAAGIPTEALFPQADDPTVNPTLQNWRRLIEAGIPVVKVALIRDNARNEDLTGWQMILAARGYDPDVVVRHLGL